DFFDAPPGAYITGIQPQPIDTLLQSDERQLIVEVNIRNQWDANAFLNFTELLCSLAHRHGNPHDIAPRRFQSPDLLDCGTHIPGVSLGHRLHGDGCITADFDFSELNRFRFTTLNHKFTIVNRRNGVNRGPSDRFSTDYFLPEARAPGFSRDGALTSSFFLRSPSGMI